MMKQKQIIKDILELNVVLFKCERNDVKNCINEEIEKLETWLFNQELRQKYKEVEDIDALL